MTELRTDRLTLRAAREGERDALFRIYSNASAMRYWDSPPHRTPDDTDSVFNKLCQTGYRRYFVWENSGEIIGAGGIHTSEELGFILHPDHWGKGLAREGTQAVIEHFWKTSDSSRITAESDPCNLASVGLLTRLGFRVTGFLRDAICVAGHWSDSVYFALPRPQPNDRG
ncbi:MAG: GNAT family N-acetyltransferase [Boseongicola sp.]|nr:GNAT family N-acetyltransferase [Boseongicola sp.]